MWKANKIEFTKNPKDECEEDDYYTLEIDGKSVRFKNGSSNDTFTLSINDEIITNHNLEGSELCTRYNFQSVICSCGTEGCNIGGYLLIRRQEKSIIILPAFDIIESIKEFDLSTERGELDSPPQKWYEEGILIIEEPYISELTSLKLIDFDAVPEISETEINLMLEWESMVIKNKGIIKKPCIVEDTIKISDEQACLNSAIVHYTERLDVHNVMRMMIEGADFNSVDDENETLLTVAVKTCQFHYVINHFDEFLKLIKDEKILAKIFTMKQKLEKTGCDYSDGYCGRGTFDAYIRNIADFTSESRIEMMKLLLKSGVDINHFEKDGLNALYHATQKADVKMVDFLIKNGAEININYYSDDEFPIFENLLEKLYIDLQIEKSGLAEMKFYDYLLMDGMDKEMIEKRIADMEKIIELFENKKT